MLPGKYAEKVTLQNRTGAGEEMEGSLTSLRGKETFPRFLPSQPLGLNAQWNYAVLLSVEVPFTLGICRDEWYGIWVLSLHLMASLYMLSVVIVLKCC